MSIVGRKRLLRIVRERGILAAHEVGERGLHRQLLTRLTREGALVRMSRGRYSLPDHPVTENHGLALAAAAVPRGVICLLSALSFHGVGTQLPPEVWVAIDRRARRPALHYPRLRVVRFGGRALEEGVETHRIEGQSVRIYVVAKTLADLFKYRNKIGMDVALEALYDAWRHRRFTMDEIDRYARVCRVERVMRPYIESLVACLLGFARPRLRAYRRETVVAEKVHAMVVLGSKKRRLRGFFDVQALARHDAFDGSALTAGCAPHSNAERPPSRVLSKCHETRNMAESEGALDLDQGLVADRREAA